MQEFDFITEDIEAGAVVRYRLYLQNLPLSFRMFITGLNSDAAFRRRFNKLLIDAPFKAYRFETPAVSSISLDDSFEFVLINAQGLSARPVDAHTFAPYFQSTYHSTGQNVDQCTDQCADQSSAVAVFKSLGGDATLIAPAPVAENEIYSHLASFTRNAPESQIDALWQTVGQLLMRDIGAEPLWLNTEGSGVAWLHVRIDTRPKYYGYADYKIVNHGKKSGEKSGSLK